MPEYGSKRRRRYPDGKAQPPRGGPGGIAYGLGNAVASRGSDQLASEPCFAFSSRPEDGIRRFGMAGTAFRLDTQGECLVVNHVEEMSAGADSLGVCKNTYNNMEVLSSDETAKLLQAATDWDITSDDVQRITERIVNLERLLMAPEGITRRDDTLRRRFLTEPMPEGSGPSTGSVLELEAMLDEYHLARGWTKETERWKSQGPGTFLEIGLSGASTRSQVHS